MTRTNIVVIVGLALLIWFALDLLLLLVAGVLLAILLRSAGTAIASHTPLSTGLSVAVVLLALVGLVVLFGWISAGRLAEQADQLTQALPAAVSDLSSWLRQYGWGQWIVEQVTSAGSDADVLGRARGAFGLVTSALVAFVVVLFTGLYLAFQPDPYIRGVLRLVPLHRRERAAEVMYAAGGVLRWWLFGQLLSMLTVGVIMGIGLAWIGVPLAFVLGVLAGLFEFIPFLGPLLGLGPAVLLALAAGGQQAAYVLLLYAGVQMLEGYVLTPLVQQRAVELPPVVTIAAQVALSWMAGPIGLLVAVPVTAVVMVATQMLYVRGALGDQMEEEWERTACEEVARERHQTLQGVLPDGPAAACDPD
jgi:predicted PurR-regulated permease PerM